MLLKQIENHVENTDMSTIPSCIIPTSYIGQRYSLQQKKLKKRIKNGLASSIALSNKHSKEELTLHFSMLEQSGKKINPFPVQCEYGQLKFYNYTLLLQTLSGLALNLSSYQNSDQKASSKTQSPANNELLALVLARLPESFLDLFGFLSILEDENDLGYKASSNSIPSAEGTECIDEDLAPIYDVTSSYEASSRDTLEQHCMLVHVKGKDISLHCLIEADTECWLKIFGHDSFNHPISSQRASHFKTRVPCSVGQIMINQAEICQLKEGDIVLLDASNIDELNQLSLNLLGKPYKLAPQNIELTRFSVSSGGETEQKTQEV